MRQHPVNLLARLFSVTIALLLISANAPGQNAPPLPPGPVAPGAKAYRTNMLLCLDISPDNSKLLVGGTDIRLFDVKTGKQLLKLSPPEITRFALFSPTKADTFATAGDDKAIRIWHLDQAEPVHVLKGHSTKIYSLAYSPDGTLLASGGTIYVGGERSLGELKLWDAETGELLQSITYDNCGIRGIAFSGDGTRIAFARNVADGGPDSSIKVYDLKQWKLVKSISFTPGFASSTTFTPDGRGLVIAGGECVPVNPRGCRPTGRLWFATFDGEKPPTLIDTPTCEYFSTPDFTIKGDRFVIGTSSQREILDRFGGFGGTAQVSEIQMRDAETGELLWAQDGKYGHPYGVQFSPDQTFIACCSSLQVLIMDPDTGKRIRTIEVEQILTPYP